MRGNFRNFDQFWHFYLGEHARPGTRRLHLAGTTLAILIAAAAVATRTWWLLAAVPVAGYSFAWLGHAAVERNRPASFSHPWWSLRADFKMWISWLTGRLGAELEAAGIGPDRSTGRGR